MDTNPLFNINSQIKGSESSSQAPKQHATAENTAPTAENTDATKEKQDTHPYTTIGKLYENITYLQRYGGDVFFTIAIITIAFIGTAYYSTQYYSQDIVKNWDTQRCNPAVMPFAGLINPPTDGTSPSEFTKQNFQDCIQKDLKDAGNIAIEPVEYSVSVVTSVIQGLADIVNSVRNMIGSMRTKSESIIGQVVGKIHNVFITLQTIIIALRDFFGKLQGILVASLYTAIGVFYTMKSSIGALFQLIVLILIALAVMILALMTNPFTIALAIPLIVIFILISIPLTLIAVILGRVFKLHLSGIPAVPGCFGKSTRLQLENGEFKYVDQIQPGDMLINNHRVTAAFTIDATHETMYKLNNNIISGTHYVWYNGSFIKVNSHPNAIRTVYDEPYIYCIGSSNKSIYLEDGLLVLDYDDMLPKDYSLLSMYHVNGYNENEIHEKMDGGFYQDTPIRCMEGPKEIQHVKVGDILLSGASVVGTVRIYAKDLKHQLVSIEKTRMKYSFWKKKNIYASHNVIKYGLSGFKPVYMSGEYTEVTNSDNIEMNYKYLYHLITSNGIFQICDTQYAHYNQLIDYYIGENIGSNNL